MSYFRVLSIVLGPMIIFSIGFSFSIYERGQEKHQKTLKKAASEVRMIFQEVLNEVTHVMKYVGNEIKNDDPKDIAKIAKHLSIVKGVNNFVDTLLGVDWVDKSNKMVASKVQGVFPVPKEVTNRQYLIDSLKNPWSLVLCEPAWGITSGLWVIPCGMGVASDKGEFLGTLTLGINIHAITAKIRQALSVFNADFIVLDAEKRTIFQSLNEKKFEALDINEKLFLHFDCLESEVKPTPGVLKLGNFFFYNCQKIPEANYYIFTAFDKQYVQNDFFTSLFPLVVQLVGFISLCLAILLIFWKRRICPITHLSELTNQISIGNTEVNIPNQYHPRELSLLAQSLQRFIQYIKESKNKLFQLNQFSCNQLELEQTIKKFINADKEKAKLLKLLNSNLSITLDKILASTCILIDNFHSRLDISLSTKHQLSFLNNIHQGIGALKTHSTNELQLVAVDVEQSIKECIAIHYPKAYAEDIAIISKIEKPIPSPYVDELKFKQILMGLLSRAIQSTPNHGKIEIEAYDATINNNKLFYLFIKDSGLGFPENNIDRFPSTSAKYSDLTSIELTCIQELIQLHSGTLTIETEWNSGTTTSVCIPYGLEEQNNTPLNTPFPMPTSS